MLTSPGFFFNSFPNKPWFLRVCSRSLLKTLWEKEKLLFTSNFSFSHSVFLPIRKTFCHFHQIWNCRLQSLPVSKSLKIVVWEKVKEANLSKFSLSFVLHHYYCVYWSSLYQLSNITIVGTTTNGEKKGNLVAVAFSNPRK